MSQKKVLIIDDEAGVADMISEFFTVFGFNTKTLLNGKTALEVVRSFGPDLITLDLNMPEISGLEILALLKKDEKSRHVPVLIISVDAESVSALEDVMNQCQGILNKPVKMKALQEKIGKILTPAID